MTDERQYPSIMNRVDLADMLGVSVRTVDRMVAERTIPFFRVGKILRFRRDEILALFTANHGKDGAE